MVTVLRKGEILTLRGQALSALLVETSREPAVISGKNRPTRGVIELSPKARVDLLNVRRRTTESLPLLAV